MRPPLVHRRSCLSISLIALVALLLGACGQSGSLYLPDKKASESATTNAPATPAVGPAPATPEAEPDEDEEKKKEPQDTAPPATTTAPSTTPQTP
ncbi:MAG: LPS translocon maturation chaperone LptM [Panacagrimonas sp.]